MLTDDSARKSGMSTRGLLLTLFWVRISLNQLTFRTAWASNLRSTCLPLLVWCREALCRNHQTLGWSVKNLRSVFGGNVRSYHPASKIRENITRQFLARKLPPISSERRQKLFTSRWRQTILNITMLHTRSKTGALFEQTLLPACVHICMGGVRGAAYVRPCMNK